MKKIFGVIAVLFMAVFVSASPAVAQVLEWDDDQIIENNYGYNGNTPKVAISGENAVAVWDQYDGSRNRIYSNYSTNSGATWSSDQPIEDNAYGGNYPQVAISCSKAVAVWVQSDGENSRIYSNYSSDGGATWGDGQIINGSGYDAYKPQVAMCGDNVVAVWFQYDESYRRIYSNYSADGGVTWGTAQTIEDNTGFDAENPHVAISGVDVVAVWSQDYGGGNKHTYCNYSPDGGANWNGDQTIENVGYNGSDPRVAMSSDRVVAVWRQYDGNRYLIYSNYSTNSGATWFTSNAQGIEDNSDYDGYLPKVAMSGDRVVAVWRQYDGSNDRIYSNYSSDGGVTWGDDQIIDYGPGYNAYDPCVAIECSNVFAVWQQYTSDYYWRIYSNYSTDGGATWNDAALIEDNEGYSGEYSDAVISGSRVVAVWRQGDESNAYRIYSNYGEFGYFGGGGGSGCFIATAAFGSPYEKHVKTLRAFRDNRLLTNRPGKAFVRWYYRHSPSYADYIRRRPAAKALVRTLLRPLAWLVSLW